MTVGWYIAILIGVAVIVSLSAWLHTRAISTGMGRFAARILKNKNKQPDGGNIE